MKKRFILSIYYLALTLFCCSCTKPYDGNLTTIPFGLSYGMTLEAAKEQLSDYQYAETVDNNGRFTELTISDNLKKNKFETICLSFYTYKKDDPIFNYAGVSDQVTSDVTLFYKAEVFLSEKLGNLMEIADKMKEQDEEFGSTGDGPYQACYLFDDIMKGGEKREKAGNIIKKLMEERTPDIISEQITLQYTEQNEIVIIFNGNVTAMLNYLEDLL